MEDNRQVETEQSHSPLSLGLLIALIVCFIIAANLYVFCTSDDARHAGDSRIIAQADMTVVLSAANHNIIDDVTATKAITQLKLAPKNASALRRIIVLKLAATQEPIDTEVLRLRALHRPREAVLWGILAHSDRLTSSQVKNSIAVIDCLDLGPLKSAARYLPYSMSGDQALANAAFDSSISSIHTRYLLILLVGCILVFVCLAGLVLIIVFYSHSREPVRWQQWTPCQFDGALWAFVIYLVLAILASLTSIWQSAFACYLAYRFFIYRGGDAASIGLKRAQISMSIKWGIGGLCAAMPIVLTLALFSNEILRSLPSPAHPLFSSLSGSTLSIVLTVGYAVIAGPIIEEIMFRGLFYGGMRSRMGMWPAAFVVGSVFAAIHPTIPHQFLPIMALGMLLCVLRERTGALTASIICHGLFNALAIAMVTVFS